MKVLIAIVGGVFLLAFGYLSRFWSEQSPVPKRASDKPVVEPLRDSSTDDFLPLPVVTTSVFKEAISLDGPQRTLTVWHSELNPSTGEWEHINYYYSSSFMIDAVATREAGEFFVAGRNDFGNEVIEKWTMAPVRGAYYFQRTENLQPLGTDIPGVPPYSVGIYGTYVPVAQRVATPQLQRVLLYSGGYSQGFFGLEVDPEGRFLLGIVDLPKRLVLFDLSAENEMQPETLYTVATLPHLAKTWLIYRRQHVSEGRIYCLEAPGHIVDDLITMLRDQDNDGGFDSTATLTPQQYLSGGYRGAVWSDNFFLYPSYP